MLNNKVSIRPSILFGLFLIAFGFLLSWATINPAQAAPTCSWQEREYSVLLQAISHCQSGGGIFEQTRCSSPKPTSQHGQEIDCCCALATPQCSWQTVSYSSDSYRCADGGRLAQTSLCTGNRPNDKNCCCFDASPPPVVTPKTPPIIPQAQVSIGINFNAPSCTANPDGTTDCKYNWIAQYINAIYNYGLSVASILAAIVLMAGGALWLISGGDSSKVTQAKELIVGSISGLVILSCAWVLLNTINPALVQLALIGGQEIITDHEPISSDGNPDNARTCPDCVNLSSTIPYKNGRQLKPDLNIKLTTAKTSSTNLDWWVTEAWPTSSSHQSTCHYNGSCVDIALKGSNSCADVTRLITILRNAQLNVLNEYPGCGGTQTTFSTGGHLHVR